jgi:dihydrofolate reductase
MRKLIYEKMVSPDGFIEDKNGSTEWAIVDEELHLHFNEENAAKGAYPFGRRLFEALSASGILFVISGFLSEHKLSYLSNVSNDNS